MAPIRLAPTFVLAPSKSDTLLTEDFDPGLSKIKAFIYISQIVRALWLVNLAG